MIDEEKRIIREFCTSHNNGKEPENLTDLLTLTVKTFQAFCAAFDIPHPALYFIATADVLVGTAMAGLTDDNAVRLLESAIENIKGNTWWEFKNAHA